MRFITAWKGHDKSYEIINGGSHGKSTVVKRSRNYYQMDREYISTVPETLISTLRKRFTT